MKKFLSFVLAIAMVLSLATFQIFPAADAAAPSLPTNDVFYGIGATGFNISIDVEEASKVAHTAGNTIEYTVTITNKGDAITKGNHLKVQIYNTSTNLLEKGIFTAAQLEFPSHNPRFSISSDSVSATGKICGKDTPTTTPDAQKFSYEYEKGVNKDLLMAKDATITFKMTYEIKESDIEQGYMRNLIVVYLGDTQAQYAVGKYVQAEIIDETVNVGKLTISNENGGNNEVYTVKLTDSTYTTPPTVETDLPFVNGVATIRLSKNSSVTGDVPAGEYTVTVTNAGDKDVSYTVDGGKSNTGRSYSGSMTRGGTCRIKFTFSDSTAADNYHLTYHFNAPSDYTSSTSSVKRDQSINEFTVEDVCDVFDNLIDHKGEDNEKRNYSIKGTSNKTYYFCGWATTALGTSAKFSEITYPVTDFSSSTRGFANPGTFTIKDTGGTGELYAVWLENPGLMGYNMSVQGGHFESREKTESQTLGDNGLSTAQAQKFVVHDSGHKYDSGKSSPMTATTETPELKGYNFVTWFNKAANKDSTSETKKDPNKNYIVQPGGTFYFGNTNNIYSLDAVWGNVTGAKDVIETYDGKEHQIKIDDLASYIRGAGYKVKNETQEVKPFSDLFCVTYDKTGKGDEELLLTGDLEINGEKVTYYYTVIKDGVKIVSEEENKTECPKYIEPGVYEYTITAKLVGVDPSNGKDTSAAKVDLTIGTITATLTILPVESLKVTKYVINGEDPDEEFKFTVTLGGEASGKEYTYRKLDADGEEIVGGSRTITGSGEITLKDEESFVFDNLPDGTTYSVEEKDLPLGYKQSITGNTSGTITDSKEVSVIFTNTYETNNLTITKEVPYCEDKTTEFTFTVTLTDGKGTKLDGTYACSGGKETSITSGGTLTLKNGDSVTIYDLPVGAKYSITENEASGYITPEEPQTGDIKTAAPSRVKFTNYKTGSLTVTKEFKLNTGITGGTATSGWDEKDVTFKVTFTPPVGMPDFTVTYKYGSEEKTAKISGENGDSIEFTLTKDTHTAGCTISGIPYGVGYDVQETKVGGVSDGHYVPQYNGKNTGSGLMDADSKTVNCVNTYHLVPTGYGALVIKKDVVGITDQTEFKFKVTFSGTGLPVSFAKEQTFTLKNGEYKLIEVPHGASYVVEEVFTAGQTKPKVIPIFEETTQEKDDDVVVGETAKGTITAGFSNDTVLFSNQYLSSMTVKKEVKVEEGFEGPDAGKEFEITVNFKNNKEYANLRVEYRVNGGAATPITKPGAVTLSLKAGDTVRFEGIPIGASHTITEDEDSRGDKVEITVDGDTTEAYSSDGTIDTDGMTVVFTNVYNTKKLSPGSGGEPGPTEPGNGGEGGDPPIIPPLGEEHISYIEGYPDGTVRPEGPITRAEVASILFRLLTDSARSAYKTTENTFPDVQKGAWYNLAVSTLQKMGILHGYEDGTFRPDRPITRAEMAAVVAQFYNTSGVTTGKGTYYKDVGAKDWYSFFVEFVTDKGIMVGVGGNSFEPNRTLTRAEAMAVFNRLLGRSPNRDSFQLMERDRDYVTWPDNSKAAWYYADVQEATNSHKYIVRGNGKELWNDALGMKHWEG